MLQQRLDILPIPFYCVFNFDAALTSSLFPLLYSFCSFGNVTDIHFPFFVIRHFPAELVLEIFLK